MRNNWATRIVVCAVFPFVAACASGPTYDQMHASEPALSPSAARLYLYREGSMVGSGLQPAIKVNGVKVGDAVPGGYFYVDEAPGAYKVSTTTEKEEVVDITLAGGQTRYIRFDVSMGLLVGHVIPSIIDPEQATKEIRECHFIGEKTAMAAPK